MNAAGRYRRLRDRLEGAGWRIEKRGGHWIGYPPDKDKRPVSIASSPGKGRAEANMAAELKRAGFDEKW